MSQQRIPRRRAVAVACALVLGPTIGLAATPALANPPVPASVVLVAADDETNTPYDRSTLVRDVAPEEAETTTPYDRSTLVRDENVVDNVENTVAEPTGSHWSQWLYPLLTLAILGSLFSLVIRRRRLLREQELVAAAVRDDTVIRD